MLVYQRVSLSTIKIDAWWVWLDSLMMLDDAWWCLMMLDDAWWCLMMLDDAWWCLMSVWITPWSWDVLSVVPFTSMAGSSGSSIYQLRMMHTFQGDINGLIFKGGTYQKLWMLPDVTMKHRGSLDSAHSPISETILMDGHSHTRHMPPAARCAAVKPSFWNLRSTQTIWGLQDDP